jgi:predicted nucleic acid-binding protein
VYAMRSDLPEHQSVYDWLESVRAERQPVALFPPVLVGLIRIATNPRIFVHPSLLGTVTNFVRALQATPRFEVLPTTDRVVARTLALCERSLLIAPGDVPLNKNSVPPLARPLNPPNATLSAI